MTTTIVNSGQSTTGLVLKNGDVERVNFGGGSYATLISGGGTELVSNGGVASGSIISGGALYLSSGGRSINTIVSSGGFETVLSGGSTTGTMVSSGGNQAVSSGGVATATIVSSGNQSIEKGGRAVDTVLMRGGIEYIRSGGVASNTTVSANGTERVSSGGNASGTIVSSGGSEIVFYGGNATGSTVSSGGSLYLSGGLITQATISSGGFINAVTIDTSVSGLVTNKPSTSAFMFSGNNTIEQGAIYKSIEVVGGGQTTGTIISSGGFENVYSGGATSGTIVSNAGEQVIYWAGTASNTTVLSGGFQYVISGGAAIGTIVSSRGQETVMSGGNTTSAVISYGGDEWIQEGGNAESTTLSGGIQEVYGTATGTNVYSSGIQYVYGSATATVIHDGGVQEVHGTATETQIDSGGIERVFMNSTVSGTHLMSGGAIDVQDLLYANSGSVSYDAVTHTLTVTEPDGVYTQVLSGDYTTESFVLSADADGSTIITDVAPCYCTGTSISIGSTEMPVEELAIGDHVLTLSGELRRIKWIGRRSYSGRFVAGKKDILPVCIKADALESGVPHRDLWISPHHAMYIDGALIEAKDLVNDVSIYQADRVEGELTYFHVELDSHDVIVAEGALAESFIDDNGRIIFHNAGDYHALYPDEAAGEPIYCAARIDEGETLEAIREKLIARAEFLISQRVA